MLDLRGYAGQMVLVGQLASAFRAHKRIDLARCYLLGTLADGQDLSASVKALIEDLDVPEPEADELLWAVQVDASGVPVRVYPLVIIDTQERLRYGADFLEAVVQTGIATEAMVVRGVQMADPEG